MPRGSRLTVRESAPPKLSIVIPAYNEARRLPPTLDRLTDYLRRQPFSWEIVVVSNGCTDRTDEVVADAQKSIPQLRLITIAERGKGVAVKTGAMASHGSVVFLCDADLSMPPEELDLFLERIARIDVVAGSREAPGAKRFGEPPHRHLLGRMFNKVVQLLAVQGINDTQCGFKAFTRCAADALFARQTLHGFGFDVELLYLAQKLGFSVEELPIDWYFDPDTRVRPGVDSLAMLWEVVMVRWRDLLGQYERPIAAGETRSTRAG